jgi:hypothetical protein
MWWFFRSIVALQQDDVGSIRSSNVGNRVLQAIHAREQVGPKLEDVSDIQRSLPDLQDQNDSTGASKVECLGEWLSGMDNLGTLVTMAVSAL